MQNNTDQKSSGFNFESVYVYENNEYKSETVNTNEELKKVFQTNLDKVKFSNFRNEIKEIVGEFGYAKIEIHPDNQFKAFDKDNTLIKES
jgi:hypothetical protein